YLAVPLAQLAHLLVLPVRVRLLHLGALDVGAGIGKVEVGRDRLADGAVGARLERERMRLVLPRDPALVEELGELLLRGMREIRRFLSSIVAKLHAGVVPRLLVGQTARTLC